MVLFEKFSKSIPAFTLSNKLFPVITLLGEFKKQIPSLLLVISQFWIVEFRVLISNIPYHCP